MKKNKEENEYSNAFFKKLYENKLYLISFIITIFVLGYGAFMGLKSSDGLITKRNKKQLLIIEQLEKAKSANDGYYSHNVTLNEKIDIGTCSVDSYDIIYEVKEGVFTKYFSNTCLGVVKLGEEQNITVKNFSFTVNNYTYDKDTNVTSLIESSNSSVNLYFYPNSIILLSDDNLILLNNNKVSYVSNKKYKNNGGNLSKRYYESSKEKDTFNYIVFYNGEEVACYDDVDKANDGDKLYEIYQIRFNTAFDKFDDPKLLISRTKGEYCINYENDIGILKQ